MTTSKTKELANTAPPSARGEEVVEHVSLLKKRDALPGDTQVDGHHLNRVKKIVSRVGLAYGCECCGFFQIRWKIHVAWLRE